MKISLYGNFKIVVNFGTKPLFEQVNANLHKYSI